MKIISRLRDRRFCAFCKSPRKLYVKKHVDLTNVLGVILVALVLTYALYGGPDPRGVFMFGIMILAGEIFIYLRWRNSVVCRMCGFDPVIYKRSPARASELVRQFFDEQASNPAFWMSKSPLLDLHRRIREDDRRRIETAGVRERAAAKRGVPVVARKGPPPSPRP